MVVKEDFVCHADVMLVLPSVGMTALAHVDRLLFQYNVADSHRTTRPHLLCYLKTKPLLGIRSG